MDSGTVEKIPHFDVVAEATDHHYLRSKHSTAINSNATSPVYLRIMKEWKILQGENNLPDSIYVQAYETRIDLMRAVIIGSPGTPYEHGLFFFDICLPSDYPNHPPKVHYISHGQDLNPNLDESGKLCLSLINTWIGSKDETWTPKSTILQTLVSIQGLVLNERPYFNDEFLSWSKKNSKSAAVVRRSTDYNHKVFFLSCNTMLHIMQKPPQNFEDFVVRHFRDRAGPILAAVKEHKKGITVMSDYLNKICSSVEIVFSMLKDGKEVIFEEKEKEKEKQRRGILRKLVSFALCGFGNEGKSLTANS